MTSSDSPYFDVIQPPPAVPPPNVPQSITALNFSSYILSRQIVAQTRIVYDRSFERMLVFNNIMYHLSKMQEYFINPDFATNQISITLLGISVDMGISSLLYTAPFSES